MAKILKVLNGICFADSQSRTECSYAVGRLGDMGSLTPDTTIVFPTRWVIGPRTHEETVAELDRIAKILVKGCEAIAGVYMRMTDMIRSGHLTDAQVREILRAHFSEPRVSEILRVSRAPEEVYRKYTAGFFGFKAALKQCRFYNVTPGDELKRRAIRRAAERLASLLTSQTTLRIKDRTITIT